MLNHQKTSKNAKQPHTTTYNLSSNINAKYIDAPIATSSRNIAIVSHPVYEYSYALINPIAQYDRQTSIYTPFEKITTATRLPMFLEGFVPSNVQTLITAVRKEINQVYKQKIINHLQQNQQNCYICSNERIFDVNMIMLDSVDHNNRKVLSIIGVDSTCGDCTTTIIQAKKGALTFTPEDIETLSKYYELDSQHIIRYIKYLQDRKDELMGISYDPLFTTMQTDKIIEAYLNRNINCEI